MGYDKNQLMKAITEAESYDGPSIVIAYAPCINHGLDMSMTQKEEKLAVDSGYWILYRYDPRLKEEGKNPLQLDSKEPSVDVTELLDNERRYSSLKHNFPENYDQYRSEMEKFVKERYDKYKKMAELL
jgi:pyruvate-ferredoxin/flavodoxin oxidoreductase